MKSNFLNLNIKDLLKGFVVVVGMAILTAVYTAIEAGNLAFTWEFFKPVLITGLGAGIAYLMKNLFTNSQDEMLKGENKS
jgi:hypothetical protein